MRVDLHGNTEEEAISAILTALMTFESNADPQLEFITGKGIVLRDVTIDLLNEEGYQWDFDGTNTGSIIVEKNDSY